MRWCILSFYIFAFTIIGGCKSKITTTWHEDVQRTGWVNLYEKSPHLAAIGFSYEGLVENYEEVDKKNLAKFHPAAALYYFFDGKVNQVEHSLSGEIKSNFWWEIELTSEVWNYMNYELGNDPSFKTHEDPRIRRKRLLGE